MTTQSKARSLGTSSEAVPHSPVIGVFAPCDPRIDQASRQRAQNIIGMVAESVSGQVVLPDHTPVPVVYSPVLVDSERQADIVAKQFPSCSSFPRIRP